MPGMGMPGMGMPGMSGMGGAPGAGAAQPSQEDFANQMNQFEQMFKSMAMQMNPDEAEEGGDKAPK